MLECNGSFETHDNRRRYHNKSCRVCIVRDDIKIDYVIPILMCGRVIGSSRPTCMGDKSLMSEVEEKHNGNLRFVGSTSVP
jgi:hypothetical protein